MTEPIKPSQVFEVFNELIAENWDGSRAVVNLKEAAQQISKRMNIPFSDVFEEKYLDIEEAYRQKGWNVVCDKPGYNERPYDPYFCFAPKVGDNK